MDAVMHREAVNDRIRNVGLVQAGNERKVAAILLTYRCTISCRHCLFACRRARPDVVMDAGPIGLAEFARREHGFDIPEQSQQKCALCFVTKCFLRRHYPGILGPGEIYE